MAWGTLTIGQLVLKETDILEDVTNANTGVRSVRVAGAETDPGNGTGAITAKQQDIMNLMDRIMPVQFSRKSSYNGYYRFTDTNTTYEKWAEGPGQVRWSLSMDYLGPEDAVDLESRLANVVRSNAFPAVTPKRWHAPASGHTTYFTGSGSAPTKLTRQASDGPIGVYLDVPAGVNPVWACPVSGYGVGRSAFTLNGVERVGTRFPCAVTGWEMNNGLIRVKPYTGGGVSSVFLAVYDGTTWREQAWDFRESGSSIKPLSHWKSVTVTRNDAECLVVRIVAAAPTNSAIRVLIDLTLRRGSRFLEVYMQRAVSGTLSTGPDADDGNGWTDMGSYGWSNGPDANGLRWFAGSAKTFSTLTSTGGITKPTTTTFDFMVGAVVPGASVGGTNTGFESGNTTGWTPQAATTLAVESTPANVKFGSFSGKITAQGGSSQARVESSLIPGTAGRQYVVGGWVKSPVALAGAQGELAIHWYNGALYMSTSSVQFPALTADKWTYVASTPFTAPASTTNISRQFALNGTPAAGAILYGDNIEIRDPTVSGETVDDLYAQYLGAMAEKVGVISR